MCVARSNLALGCTKYLALHSASRRSAGQCGVAGEGRLGQHTCTPRWQPWPWWWWCRAVTFAGGAVWRAEMYSSVHHCESVWSCNRARCCRRRRRHHHHHPRAQHAHPFVVCTYGGRGSLTLLHNNNITRIITLTGRPHCFVIMQSKLYSNAALQLTSEL